LAGAAGLLLTAVVALAIGTVLIRQQQVHTQQAKELAEQQRDRAKQNFALAKRAVEDTITKVAENQLLEEAGFHDLRKQLLSSAVPYYQEFVRQQSDDPELEAERGRAYRRLAVVRAEMGEIEEALAGFREAAAIFAHLEAAFFDQAAFPQELSHIQNDLGRALAELGRHGEAEREYRAALVLQEKLVKEFPAVPEYHQDLADSHKNLGTRLRELGRLDEAEMEFRAALILYTKLAEQFTALPDYRQSVAGCHNNLGLVLDDLRRYHEAETEYRTALILSLKLTQQFPVLLDYRRVLATSHKNLGGLMNKLDRYGEAEKELRAALALENKLVEQYPTVPDCRQGLAGSHNNLGFALANLGRREEAEKAYRAAVALYVNLAEQFPALPAYRRELATSHRNLGKLLRDLGRRGEAEKEYRVALALLEKLAEQFPAVPAYTAELAALYIDFGYPVLDQGHPEAALPWLDKAIARLQPVLTKGRPLPREQLILCVAHWSRASTLTHLNRHTDAIRDWDRAIELDEGSMRNEFRLRRTVCLAHAGEHARAVVEANALIEGKDVSGSTLYDAACVCALAAANVKDNAKLSQQYAGRAVALLRQAQKAGYFKQPANIAHMKKDNDLRALRARPDYRNLLKELETPAKP
jgi:tetratricopeptide (TPR) repeat protein